MTVDNEAASSPEETEATEATEAPSRPEAPTTPETGFRSGFVSFIGRPNVGKSTLTNALVGEKVAITSSKPQTTRRAIRGIVHRADGQLVLVDTPGMHRPRTLLGERLNSIVQTTIGDVDVIGFCMPANEKLGPGDRFISEQLDSFPRAKKVAIVTKIDATSRPAVAEQLLAVSELRDDWAAIIPTSATSMLQLDTLVAELIKLMPVSPPLYPLDAVTDEGLSARISELIREAALEGVMDELPHSIAVTLDDIVEREDKDLIEVYANLFVERDSQKGIIIGHKGERLQEVGARARHEIEKLVGKQVFLSMRVKVAKEWQRNAKELGRLGF
jgi:GTP-binding protein Era